MFLPIEKSVTPRLRRQVFYLFLSFIFLWMQGLATSYTWFNLYHAFCFSASLCKRSLYFTVKIINNSRGKNKHNTCLFRFESLYSTLIQNRLHLRINNNNIFSNIMLCYSCPSCTSCTSVQRYSTSQQL